MRMTAFRITMFKCVLDSGRVPVEPLTALVGKNESGKTSLLQALHLFNPFTPEPYSIDRDWPRGHRDARSLDHDVCAVEFALEPEEKAELATITNGVIRPDFVTVTRNYRGQVKVLFPPAVASDKLFPSDIEEALEPLPTGATDLSMHKKAHDFIIQRLPTFVYMDEYRAFRGTAMLDQTKQRKDGKTETEEDKTILAILSLSGLTLDKLVAQGEEGDRELRRYDLSDGAATLMRQIKNHWGQLRYELQFDADGQQFFTFVKDERDRALIKLEERSKGFQWFFSFDLLLMHETKGALKGCVILLDEPGLHLHPEGQTDLLTRLEAYAEGNTLLYTTHLPFMLDLQHPERMRVISETDTQGTCVTEDLARSQPAGRLTLQASLGIGAKQSYLVSEQNLVVDGVDDYWILAALSNLLKRSRQEGLPEYVRVTPAGGAAEVTYIATLMTSHTLEVVALYDTDDAGNTARNSFVEKWLGRYGTSRATALSLGPAVGVRGRDFSIEDVFPDDFYLTYVSETYQRQLGGSALTLRPGGQLIKRVEEAFAGATNGFPFNRVSVAKRLCSGVARMTSMGQLPDSTRRYATELFRRISEALQPPR